MVICDMCKVARLDGPELCPKCGVPLRSLTDAERGRSEEDASEPGPGRSNRSSPWIDPGPAAAVDPPASSPLVERRLRGKPHSYTYRGETLSLLEWSRRLGITYATLYYRLSSGWSLEEAFKTPAEKEQSITLGDRSQTISSWAAELGLTVATIRKRLRKGLPPEEVLAPGRLSSRRATKKDLVREDGPARPAEISGAPETVEDAAVSETVDDAHTSEASATVEEAEVAEVVELSRPARGSEEKLPELPDDVLLLRQRCARLDEIEYEIALLLAERGRVAEALRTTTKGNEHVDQNHHQVPRSQGRLGRDT